MVLKQPEGKLLGKEVKLIYPYKTLIQYFEELKRIASVHSLMPTTPLDGWCQPKFLCFVS